MYPFLFQLLVLWWLDAHTGWAKNRRTRRRVLLVSTLALLFLQAGLAYDLQSYYQGAIEYRPRGMGLYQGSLDIQPGESFRIGSMSNFYTVVDLWVYIGSGPSNVTLFMMDENTPQVRNELGNYSQAVLWFRLPYRYSRPFVIASWTVNLYNPSQNETIYVYISISSDSLMVDPPEPEKRWIDFSHLWPLIAIATLWLYTGFSMVHEFWSFEQKKLRMAEMHQTQYQS